MNPINRRTFLSHGLAGLGSLAFSRLYASESALQLPHYRPKIKRVIHLCMAGGPSHLESFDYKAELAKLDGKEMPESFTKGQQLAQLQGKALRCMGPQWEFNKHGQSQAEISEIFPHIAKHADDIAIIRSMKTEQINHDPAHTFMNTGYYPRPSLYGIMGALRTW
jgi:hypothetical protein